MSRVPRTCALALCSVACAGPPAPCANAGAGAPVQVAVPEKGPPEPAAVTELPSAMLRPLVVDRDAALLPDARCMTGPVHVLGYRPLPDAERSASFFLVGSYQACEVTTRKRVELLLGKSESLAQVGTCNAWSVESCADPPLMVAVPSPPFREVKVFSAVPDWHEMDVQSDGLGEARRSSYVDSVPGTQLSVLHTRKGFVEVVSAGKSLDAFWGKAFFTVDGVAYIATPEELIRLSLPLEHLGLPGLHTGFRSPEPLGDPWRRGEN